MVDNMPKSKLEVPQLAASSIMTLPQPPPKNAEEYLKAYTGYSYTAISSISQEVASIDFHLYKAKFVKGQPESTEIYEHPLLSLLRHVNSLITFYDLIEATQSYLELLGESFWVVLKDGKVPRELWPIRPDWVKIVPDPVDVIKEYTYHPGGGVEKVTIPKENMIPFKYFNPLNPYRGKGSIHAAALSIDTHNFAQEYNRNFFFNSAIPSLVFTSEKPLAEAVVKRFINQWQASYGGRSKSNKVAFLGNGLKMDKISVGGKEMDFAEQQKMMRDDILAVFKVPKTILGMTDEVNYANAMATTRAFMERTITPRMRKLVETLNEFLVPMYGDDTLFLDFTDPAPEDVEMKLKKYENALKYGWMTPNEIRAEENMEPVEGGDELPKQLGSSFGKPSGEEGSQGEEESAPEAPKKPKEGEEEERGISALLSKIRGKKTIVPIVKPKLRALKKKAVKHMVRLPVKTLEVLDREKLEKELTPKIVEIIGALLEKKGVDTVGFKENGEDSKEKPVLWTNERKDAYWNKFIKKADANEMELRNLVVDLFRTQEQKVLDNLDRDVKHWKVASRRGLESSVIPSLAELDLLWRVLWDIAVREMYIDQGNETLDFLGAGGNIDVTTQFATAYLEEYSATLIREISTTTRDQLRKVLAEGFKRGEGIDKLKNRVKEVFKGATTARAEMIARTESLKASNAATVEAYRQSGVVEAKEWLAERDSRCCLFCLALDGKVIGLNKNYFDKGDTYTVDGSTMKFDFTNVGEPPAHPACRCTTIPVIVGSKSYTLEQKAENAKKKKEELEKDVKSFVSEKTKEITEGALVEADKEIEKREEEVIKKAEKEAKQLIEKAKREITKEVISIKDESAEQGKKEGEVLVNKAKDAAKTVISEAIEKSKKIVEVAKKEGEVQKEKALEEADKEKFDLLKELRALRDKTKEVLGGKS